MSDDDNMGWETVPNNKKRERQLFKNSKNHNVEEILPWVSYIPPTDQNTNYEPFMVLLCGIPGSGKSTFGQALEMAMPYKFVRVNQDELKTRSKCHDMVRQVLSNNKQCPVVDRCNFDQQQRASFVAIATEMGVPVDCIVLDTTATTNLVTVEECIYRCQQRRNHPGLSPQEAKGIVLLMTQQMNPPLSKNNSEGIRTVTHVTDMKKFHDTVVTYWNMKR